MKLRNYLFFMFILLFVFASNSNAQIVGQIFTKKEANERYGAVKEFVNFPKRDLEVILNKCDEYIMFNILEGNLYILNSKREVLYPEGKSVNENQAFYYFSKSIVEALIKYTERQTNIQVELREEVLSITYGNFTLELVIICPPVCP